MILLASMSAFLFVFFLTYSFSKIIRAEEQEALNRIAHRLKTETDKRIFSTIEKKRRLSDVAVIDQILGRFNWMKKLQNYISQGGLTFSVGSFILLSLLSGVISLLGLVFIKTSFLVTFTISSITTFLPFFIVAFKRGQRTKKFSNRFPDAISLMASSLRAGHSLQMATGSVVNEGKDIVSIEFEKVLSEVEVGQSFEEALKGILLRIDTQELRLFVSAVILQRETGGNLAEILDNLEDVIRDRQELKRELKAATAQARLSGIVLSLLPIFVGLMVLMIHPDYILFFFKDNLGTKLLFFSIVGQCLGILTIQKIVKIQL